MKMEVQKHLDIYKEKVKGHLSLGYNREMSLDEFYSWAEDAYCLEKKEYKILASNAKKYLPADREELEKLYEHLRNSREARKFAREAYPLKVFLKSNCSGLSFDSVFLTNKNEKGEDEKFDAILKKGSQKVLVEITSTEDGERSLYSRKHSLKFDFSPTIGVAKKEYFDAIKSDTPVQMEYKLLEEGLKKEVEKDGIYLVGLCDENCKPLSQRK